MKNRTVIGIICMVIAIAFTFIVAPLVSRMTTDSTDVPRLSADIRRGTEITEDMLETASVKKDSLPAGVITDKAAIIGKYAAADLFAGDYLTEFKVSGEANSAEDVFASLDGSKVAVSVSIDTFAAGLSGKLKNGDIISFVVVNRDTGKSTIPAELNYVRVITATTTGGVDQENIIKNDDGTYEIPSTVTVLVNTAQAKLLAKYQDNSKLSAALVYRGDSTTANKFLAVQDEYFANLEANPDAEPTETEDEEEGGSGTDIIKKANDIINGKADYYDVEEALDNE